MLPGCSVPARVFVGQRRDPFAAKMGQTLDLFNVEDFVSGKEEDNSDDSGNRDSVTSFAVEVHKSCLVGDLGGVAAGWASLSFLKHVGVTHRHTLGAQKSRFGNPLVSTLLIGFTEKDAWSVQHPQHEEHFLVYYEYPTLPEMFDILFGARIRNITKEKSSLAPRTYPRADVRDVLLRGIPDLTFQTATVPQADCDVVVPTKPSFPPLADILRLNMRTPSISAKEQNALGIIGGDSSGYPNGRRPGDDVFDIFLRLQMGVFCHTHPGLFNYTPEDAPAGKLPISDGVRTKATSLLNTFPYLSPPLPGSLLPCDPIPQSF